MLFRLGERRESAELSSCVLTGAGQFPDEGLSPGALQAQLLVLGLNQNANALSYTC